MTKPIMVIIDEAKWCSGARRKGDSYCALGYLLKAAEVSVADVLAEEPTLEEVQALYALMDRDRMIRVWKTNDRGALSTPERKLELTRLFREQGMVLCFVDSSKPQAVEEPAKATCSWVTA